MNCKTVLPPPLRILSSVVNHIADQIAKLNNSNHITCEFQFKPSEHPSLIYFDTFYELFLQVLTAKKLDTPPVLTTVPPPSQHSSPYAESTSTGVSKPQSTTSGASKPEHYTQGSAATFLLNTYQTVKETIAELAWWNEGKKGKEYGLRFSLFVPPLVWLIIRNQQDMKVELGPKDKEGRPLITLVAKSDGGCSFTAARKYDRTFAAIPIEVTVEVVVAADIRLNVRKQNCWTKKMVIRRIRKRLKNVIKIMLPRFTRKCWVLSVIKLFMTVTQMIQRDVKRLRHALMFIYRSLS
jgi:hypothetical protein